MAGRGKQRATFEKRQRELARQERQAEKRARRQGRIEDEPRDGSEPVHDVILGEWPTLATDETRDADVAADVDATDSPTSSTPS
jgi:hypothetical protein